MVPPVRAPREHDAAHLGDFRRRSYAPPPGHHQHITLLRGDGMWPLHHRDGTIATGGARAPHRPEGLLRAWCWQFLRDAHVSVGIRHAESHRCVDPPDLTHLVGDALLHPARCDDDFPYLDLGDHAGAPPGQPLDYAHGGVERGDRPREQASPELPSGKALGAQLLPDVQLPDYAGDAPDQPAVAVAVLGLLPPVAPLKRTWVVVGAEQPRRRPHARDVRAGRRARHHGVRSTRCPRPCSLLAPSDAGRAQGSVPTVIGARSDDARGPRPPVRGRLGRADRAPPTW